MRLPATRREFRRNRSRALIALVTTATIVMATVLAAPASVGASQAGTHRLNLSHTLGQMLHCRPRNRFEDLENVYLVGGGTHPGSGLPVIFESARISARLLLDDLRINRGWIDVPSTLEVPEYAG